MKDKFIDKVVSLAEEALEKVIFPNGALITQRDRLVCESISMSEQITDPTAHADIRAACEKEKSANLKEYSLYTSLEPCLMCFYGSYWAGIRRIIYCCTRYLVSEKCFEGKMSCVSEAYKHTHENIELIYDESLTCRVVALHSAFQEKIKERMMCSKEHIIL